MILVLKKVESNRGRVTYRGVTLAETLYKMYAEVLTGRLREKLERKGMIPENQAGFRKRRSTMDNIYTVNYLANRNLCRKRRKLMALFIDLKASFDIVNRKVLLRAMRERRMRAGLLKRYRNLYSIEKQKIE